MADLRKFDEGDDSIKAKVTADMDSAFKTLKASSLEDYNNRLTKVLGYFGGTNDSIAVDGATKTVDELKANVLAAIQEKISKIPNIPASDGKPEQPSIAAQVFGKIDLSVNDKITGIDPRELQDLLISSVVEAERSKVQATAEKPATSLDDIIKRRVGEVAESKFKAMNNDVNKLTNVGLNADHIGLEELADLAEKRGGKKQNEVGNNNTRRLAMGAGGVAAAGVGASMAAGEGKSGFAKITGLVLGVFGIATAVNQALNGQLTDYYKNFKASHAQAR